METSLPQTISSICKVSWNKPVYYLSLSENSSGYEQTIRNNNMQLMELQFYIKNIARCLGIVDLLSVSRQDHQFNIFTIVLLSYKSIIYKQPSF